MRIHTKRLRGFWQSFRFACAGFALAATMLLLPVEGLHRLGEKAEADQLSNTSEDQNPSRRGISAAYVYDKQGLTFSASSAAHLDQMNFSFALIKDGKVSGAHWQSIGAFQKFIAANPHITPILSIGGWGADGFSQAASTAQGRSLFAETALALMERYGFAGLDIDWEYPGSTSGGIAASPDDKENFTLLLKELRSGLDALTAKDGKARMLCIAVGADRSLTGKIDCVAVGKLVDQVNLMTYDMQQAAVTTHHANLFTGNSQYPASADAAVRDYVAAGIPRSKLMIGAAFYGRTFTLSDAAANAFASGGSSSNVLYQANATRVGKHYSYAAIKTMIQNGTSTRYYDETAQAPYLFDGKTFISYDDPISIIQKGKYAVSGGLMGLMCWEYGDDSAGELLKAMSDSLQ